MSVHFFNLKFIFSASSDGELPDERHFTSGSIGLDHSHTMKTDLGSSWGAFASGSYDVSDGFPHTSSVSRQVSQISRLSEYDNANVEDGHLEQLDEAAEMSHAISMESLASTVPPPPPPPPVNKKIGKKQSFS